MTVKELKTLLELPEGINQEDFDRTEVLISDLESSSTLDSTKFDDSGYVVFQGKCDEDGNLLSNDEKYNYPAFLIAIAND